MERIVQERYQYMSFIHFVSAVSDLQLVIDGNNNNNSQGVAMPIEYIPISSAVVVVVFSPCLRYTVFCSSKC